MVTELHDSNFDEELKGKTALVDFWAEWCGPCVGFAPFFKEASLKAKMPFYKCNVDANQRMAAKYRVMSIPTLIVFRNGIEIDRVQGGMEVDALLHYLKPYEATS